MDELGLLVGSAASQSISSLMNNWTFKFAIFFAAFGLCLTIGLKTVDSALLFNTWCHVCRFKFVLCQYHYSTILPELIQQPKSQ